MHPFEFIIAFFSFVFALALTHLLLSMSAMIKNRRRITFSLPHLLWMLDALILVLLNWITFWDFHLLKTITLAAIVSGFAFCVVQYLVCALVTPDFETDGFDLNAFHESNARTYIGAIVALDVVAIVLNYSAGSYLNVANWAQSNVVVVPILLLCLAPLFIRARWVQIAAPALLFVVCFGFLVTFYPILR